jgi:carbamoyl-phosphate synthase large subunit
MESEIMNILICSVGVRAYLVEWFKEKFTVFATDRNKKNPALYFADDDFVLDDKDYPNYRLYIQDLCKKCQELNITHLISLNDFQVLEFTKNKYIFDSYKITLLHSDYKVVNLCMDKSKYKELSINQIPTVIIKDTFGSGSSNLIRQPYIEGKEYNVQCYFDFFTSELIDMFIQEKIKMKNGETYTSISTWDDDIYYEIMKLNKIGLKCAIDIDVIKSDKPYIIDINTRFGGGYPLAHECKKDFIEYIKNNNIALIPKSKEEIQDYPTDEVMMKYNKVLFKKDIK